MAPLNRVSRHHALFVDTSWLRKTLSKLSACQFLCGALTGRLYGSPKDKCHALWQVGILCEVVYVVTLVSDNTMSGTLDSHLGWSVVGISSISDLDS